MAERDPSIRLRNAVKDNNLFLVKRLVQRTDMRNPDPGPRRLTSLAWAAVLGHEETFHFLLNAGHDDTELSKDTDGNTVLMLLADRKPSTSGSHPAHDGDNGPTLRMARSYHERYVESYPYILDWANTLGKTMLHIAALNGNEELVSMLCDLDADVDLPDVEGSTPLHHASAWGHITIVQMLIERGCQFNAKNNQGFSALDYAYSFSTKDSLENSVRNQYELKKKSRRRLPVSRTKDLSIAAVTPSLPITPPTPTLANTNGFSSTTHNGFRSKLGARIRSGSGTSRTTNTSDSGDLDGSSHGPSYHGNSQSSASSPSHTHVYQGNGFSDRLQPPYPVHAQSPGHISSTQSSQASTLQLPPSSISTFSPIVTRTLERDQDAMQKYILRNRSGSSSTTDTRSTSAGRSDGDDGPAHVSRVVAATSSTGPPQRRLRPSYSAAQLRTQYTEPIAEESLPDAIRNRSGTNPSSDRPPVPPIPPNLSRSSSQRSQLGSSRSYTDPTWDDIDGGGSVGGGGGGGSSTAQYARYVEPPLDIDTSSVTTPTSARKLLFNIRSRPAGTIADLVPLTRHRRGSSSASLRTGA